MYSSVLLPVFGLRTADYQISGDKGTRGLPVCGLGLGNYWVTWVQQCRVHRLQCFGFLGVGNLRFVGYSALDFRIPGISCLRFETRRLPSYLGIAMQSLSVSALWVLGFRVLPVCGSRLADYQVPLDGKTQGLPACGLRLAVYRVSWDRGTRGSKFSGYSG